MRSLKSFVIISVLALFAMSCAPHHRPCPGGPGGPGGGPCGRGMHKEMMMMHGCGPDSCTYGSRCFSSGAIRSNDGACQECNGGRWVASSGCREGCGMHHGKKGDMPCEHHHQGGPGHKH